MIEFEAARVHSVEVSLQMVEVDFQDELWSPFPTTGTSYNYIKEGGAPSIAIKDDADYI